VDNPDTRLEAVGRLTPSQIATSADGNGHALTYAYDEFNRPTQLS